MSTRFVSVDRYQPLLLPPDLRDWIPEDNLVHIVIAAVEGLDSPWKIFVRIGIIDLTASSVYGSLMFGINRKLNIVARYEWNQAA